MWVLKTELRPSGLAASEPLSPRSRLTTRVGFLLIFGCFQCNWCRHAVLSSLFYLRLCCVFFVFIRFGGLGVVFLNVLLLFPDPFLSPALWRLALSWSRWGSAFPVLCSCLPFTLSSFECHGCSLRVCWLYVIVRHVCICHWVSAVSASDVCFISLWCRRWNLG